MFCSCCSFLLQERRLFPVFDTAYLGYATGDVDNDAWPVRELVRQGTEFFIAQSFSKNFGLYSKYECKIQLLNCLCTVIQWNCYNLVTFEVARFIFWE